MACTGHSKRQGCKFFVKVILALVDFKKNLYLIKGQMNIRNYIYRGPLKQNKNPVAVEY